MITVTCFLWGHAYRPAHVNALAALVREHYRRPHRFVVVTNDRGPFAPGVAVVADDEDFARTPSPAGAGMPSCYRRLRLWRADAAETFGERIVCLDLDVLLVDDVAPLWDREDDVVLYRDPLWPHQVNGSMLMLRAGTRPDVWAAFDPMTSPALARAAGFRGSDQAWLSYKLPHAARWSGADGVYSYRRDCAQGIPADARVIVFHGRPKPWDVDVQQAA